MTANRAASIRARVKQLTDTSKQDFNLTLARYGLERLLYRPTRDADLLGFGPEDVPTLVDVFRSLCGSLSDTFANDTSKQKQWRAFLSKNKLEPMELPVVINAIRERALRFKFAGE